MRLISILVCHSTKIFQEPQNLLSPVAFFLLTPIFPAADIFFLFSYPLYLSYFISNSSHPPHARKQSVTPNQKHPQFQSLSLRQETWEGRVRSRATCHQSHLLLGILCSQVHLQKKMFKDLFLKKFLFQ